MSTDGPDPAPCRQDLYDHGETVAVIGDTGGSNRFERLIQAASRRAGVPIDWHFVGGRARVLALPGDVVKAKEALDAEVFPVLNGLAPEGTLLVREEWECRDGSQEG